MKTEKDMMHGRDWNWQDLTGRILTEKFDGCRGYWDGSKMWSRSGAIIDLPIWFLRALPTFPLDGEIWAGYGNFQLARVAVQHGKWFRPMSFKVFDCPDAIGDWKERISVAQAIENDTVQAVKFTVCRNNDHAFDFMRAIQSKRGEGAIARDNAAPYKAGRSNAILKLLTDARISILDSI